MGRRDECGRIEKLLADAAAGITRCLVVEGDPGIGKTALLEYAAAAADGFCVLSATGIQADAGLGFAGLLEVTRPVSDLLGVVPAPQADALRGALGLGAPLETSRFLVAAGLLSLLAAAAERSPVLVLVDDLQWIDQPSAQALLFAVRRLRADRVGVIMTVRSWRHPLVRSAVYYSAPAADRAAAHRAVADGLPESQPGWAWHRAAAADGPDEQVAIALDRIAADASRRAGFATAARAAEQAAGLSASPQDAARRRLAAADAAWLAGDAERAERLLDEALAGTDQDDLRGRVLHLRGHTEYAAGHVRRACDLFASAAALLERDAPDAAADALAHATLARWWNADPDGMSAAAGQLRALAKAHPQLASHADFFTGLTAMFTGHNREGAALIESVLAAEPPDGPGASDGPRSVQRLAGLGWLGRCGEGHDLGVRRLRALRAQGAFGMLPRLLRMTASQGLDDDRWAEAAALANEALEVCDELGQPAHRPEVLGMLATVAAFRGDTAACRSHADAALEAADRHGQQWARLIALRACGLLALGQGDLAGAASLFEQVVAVPLARGLRGPTVVSLPDLVEALVRLDRHQEAAIRAAEFERRVTDIPDPRAPALVARCRALIGAGTDAGADYQQALDSHQGDPDSFVIARTRLLYGEWLRRQGERRSARTELDAALEVFEKYGATPWAERARAELRATGAVLRSQPQAGLELTAAELRVALLAADGLTDREICGQLYLSPKTVEFHLGRVYRKLAVRGRTELARRLPGREESGSG